VGSHSSRDGAKLAVRTHPCGGPMGLGVLISGAPLIAWAQLGGRTRRCSKHAGCYGFARRNGIRGRRAAELGVRPAGDPAWTTTRTKLTKRSWPFCT
jgi:hypothetical protein